jgi:hypothetical protein
MIITPKKDTPNITQSLIRNFIPIPNYDSSFGIIGMYSSLEWMIEGDTYIHRFALYVVIDPMEIAIEIETIHRYLINRSEEIILVDDKIVIVFDLDEYILDVTKILSGRFSQVSKEGKAKLLEGIPESRDTGDGRVRDSRWTILHPTKNELNRLCRVLGVANGTVCEILSKPEIKDETFWINVKKETYDLLWAMN